MVRELHDNGGGKVRAMFLYADDDVLSVYQYLIGSDGGNA